MDKIELERYTRHILLKEIGGSGQKLLKNSCVTMVGAGGLGSIILYYLAAAGIGNIRIVDNLAYVKNTRYSFVLKLKRYHDVE